LLRRSHRAVLRVRQCEGARLFLRRDDEAGSVRRAGLGRKVRGQEDSANQTRGESQGQGEGACACQGPREGPQEGPPQAIEWVSNKGAPRARDRDPTCFDRPRHALARRSSFYSSLPAAAVAPAPARAAAATSTRAAAHRRRPPPATSRI